MDTYMQQKGWQIEKETLKEEMRSVIEEARMVLPGMQALFGFQTISVFSDGFGNAPMTVKYVYLLALALVALTMGLLMTPAAYNRIAERGQVSRRMVELLSWLITIGMIPMMLAVALDVNVVVDIAQDAHDLAVGAAAATAILLGCLWFAFPLLKKRANSTMRGVRQR
jgi:cobalamin synthase